MGEEGSEVGRHPMKSRERMRLSMKTGSLTVTGLRGGAVGQGRSGWGYWCRTEPRKVNTQVGFENERNLLTVFVGWVVGGGMVDHGQGGAPCRGEEFETQVIRVRNDLGLWV